MDAVRECSRTFDDWDPPDFELSPSEIDEAIGKCGDQVIADTTFCQGNVRAFAEAQLTTLLPLETEIRLDLKLLSWDDEHRVSPLLETPFSEDRPTGRRDLGPAEPETLSSK